MRSSATTVMRAPMTHARLPVDASLVRISKHVTTVIRARKTMAVSGEPAKQVKANAPMETHAQWTLVIQTTAPVPTRPMTEALATMEASAQVATVAKAANASVDNKTAATTVTSALRIRARTMIVRPRY